MRGLVAKGDDVLVLMGSECDFAPVVIELALAVGFTAITLVECRLRTETAALASVMNTAFIND